MSRTNFTPKLSCVRPNIVPKEPHFGILSFSKRWNGDDQEVVCSYDAYGNRAAWEEEIHRRVTSVNPADHEFVPMHVSPAAVEVRVETTVNIKSAV